MRCDFRTLNECTCPADSCAARKPITPAPVVLPSWRTQAITCLFLGVVATFVSAAVMEMHYRGADRVQQESSYVAR